MIMARCKLFALLLVATLTGIFSSAPAITYVPGSLTNGTEDPVSTLNKMVDPQNYISIGKFGQGAADYSTRWSFVIDLESTQTVSSVGIYGWFWYVASVSGPGGLCKIEAASAPAGPFTEIAAHDFGNDRTLNPWSGGKGKRIVCTPTAARYLRISSPWANVFDNAIMISEIQINPKLVLHDLLPLHNPNTSNTPPNPVNAPQQYVFNQGPEGAGTCRIGVDMVDGITTATGGTFLKLMTITLDAKRPNTAGISALVISPWQTNVNLLPKTGEIYVFPGDNPAAAPQLLQAFDVTAANRKVTIPLNNLTQRYFQIHWTSNQLGSTADTAVAVGEIDYTTVEVPPAPPVSVTSLGVLPNDGLDDSAAIQAALANHDVLYFPAGIYTLASTVFVPSNRSIHGAGMTQTVFDMATDADAFRLEGVHDVYLSDFGMDYSDYDDSFNEAIFIYPSQQDPTQISYRVQLNKLRVLNRRSRSSAFFFHKTYDCAVRHCEVINNTRWIWAPPDGIASYDPPEAWQIYGAGITFGLCDKIVIEHNRVYETEEQVARLTVFRPPWYLRYFQASAIQVAGCTNALVQYNWIKYTGQGIDSNGTNGALIRGNYIENCQSHGLKFAHFCRNQRLVGNYIKYAGLMGIAFNPGNDEPTIDCTAEDNIFVGGGKGIGQGWWNPTGSGDYPSCIGLDKSDPPGVVSTGSIFRNNRSYDNDKLTTAPTGIGQLVVMRTGPGQAIIQTNVNNLLMAGPAPAPPPFPYPAPLGLPLSQSNATVDTTDSLVKASDGLLTTGAVFTQAEATTDSRWSFVLDLETTTRTISSIALYGASNYRADEAAPGGLVEVEFANSLQGPFTLAGSRDFGNDPTTNPFTGGKGKRIQLSPTTARFLRISGGTWRNSFANRVIIAEILIDPPVVLDSYAPVHNPLVPLPNPAGAVQQSVWNVGSGLENERVGLDAVDGKLNTGIDPLRHIVLTLDVAPSVNGYNRIVDNLTVAPLAGDTTRLPKTGALRASSTESPATMDLLLNSYSVAAVNSVVTIPTNTIADHRYLQLDVLTLQDNGTADARLKLAEIQATARDSGKSTAENWLVYE